MIAAAIFLFLAQVASAPSPVVVVDNAQNEQPVDAISWSCEAMMSRHGGSLMLSGQFPAVSLEAQKNGDAFKLQATMKSGQDQRFNGTFPSALTANSAIAGISAYSVLIPGTEVGRPKFVLRFETFAHSKDGFVNILQTDPSSAAPSAFATGICKYEPAQ
jgi:hypothetical protein